MLKFNGKKIFYIFTLKSSVYLNLYKMITLILLEVDGKRRPGRPKIMWKNRMENNYCCEWHLTKLEKSTPKKKRTPGSS